MAPKIQKTTIDIPTSIDVFHYENGEFLFPHPSHYLERPRRRRRAGSENARVGHWAFTVFAHA